MDDADDALTPRGLISAVLKHNEPQQTVRRSARRRSRRSFKRRQSETPFEVADKGSNLDQASIDNVGSSHVSADHQLPATTTKSGKDEEGEALTSQGFKRDKILPTVNIAGEPKLVADALRKDITDASQGNHVRKTPNVLLHPEIGRKISDQHPVLSTRTEEIEHIKKYKPRVKRMRLSNIDVADDDAPTTDSFSMQVLSVVKALANSQESRPVVIDGMRKRKTPGTTQKRTSKKALHTAEKRNQASQTAKMPSPEDNMRDLEKGHPKPVIVSQAIDTLQSELAEGENFGLIGPDNSISKLAQIDANDQPEPDADSVILPNVSQDYLTKEHDDLPLFDIIAEDLNSVTVGMSLDGLPQPPNFTSLFKEQEVIPKNAHVSRSKSSVLKKVKKRSKLPDLPISRSHLLRLIRHFSNLKFNSLALGAIEGLSRRFLASTAKSLEQICRKNGRSSVSLETAKTLMERKGVLEKKSLTVLVEENFPVEYREILIPIARSGNEVFPKKGTLL